MSTLFKERSTPSKGLRSVYTCICYFDIFNYPLTTQEIQRFCAEPITHEEILPLLDELFETGKLKKFKDYYFLPSRTQQSVELRLNNELRLSQNQKKINRYAQRVGSFPFVQAAFISGSVSKGVMDEKGDVDYFIIASPGRLWVCRTLLVLYRKIILLNSRKYFCTNYFIDTNNLRVPDTNVFVATEIKTLQPIKTGKITEEFFKANEWANALLPNYSIRNSPIVDQNIDKPILSRWLELIFAGALGEKIDKLLLRLTVKRWKRKFPHFNEEEFDNNLRSYRNVSKSHANGNQFMVLQALNERLKNFD